MPGFDAIYKQTVTLFNRKDVDGVTFWYVSVLAGVHLKIDRAIMISTYGEQASDNAMLHIQYTPNGRDAVVKLADGSSRIYLPPKAFRSFGDPMENITFAFGDNFDFIIAGEHDLFGPINDEEYKSGFFNYMNKTYDNVFAITNCSKFNLIPHFEITAR
jgi:hypothetical protein